MTKFKKMIDVYKRQIYTREDLAGEMQISYRKAISCFKELTEKHLVWEQRQGRGLPNRIYLAQTRCFSVSSLKQEIALQMCIRDSV